MRERKEAPAEKTIHQRSNVSFRIRNGDQVTHSSVCEQVQIDCGLLFWEMQGRLLLLDYLMLDFI